MFPAIKSKLTPEMLDRAGQLLAGGMSKNQIREQLLDEFGVNVARSTLIEALQRHDLKKRREIVVKKVEVEEAKLNAEAARTVAASVAATDLPEDAKLIQLRLAAIVGRANGAWDGMTDREKTSFRTWAKLEDLALKYLFLKLRLGGALTPEDADLDATRATLRTKLDALRGKKTSP